MPEVRLELKTLEKAVRTSILIDPDVNVHAPPAPVGDLKTLEQFIIERQEEVPHSTGEFSRLLRDISLAAKIVNRDVRRAGLVDIFGETGEINIQGEIQKKLDALAHTEFVRALKKRRRMLFDRFRGACRSHSD